MKFKKLNFIGGQDPLDSTDRQIRAERVLSAILQVFLTSGQGWELDPRHANGEDYFRFKTWNQSGVVQTEEYPALFLKNSISGCKMFFGINLANSCGIALPTPQVVAYENLSYPPHCGFLISIIPGDSEEEFGTTLDENFIPTSATKIIGSSGSTNTSYSQQYIRANTTGTYYSFGFFIDPYYIGIAGGYSATNSTPPLKLGLLVGRIFGHLFHNETLPQARYGCLKLTTNEYANNSEFLYYVKKNYYDSKYFLGANFSANSDPSDSQKYYGMCFSASGTPIFGNSVNSWMILHVVGSHQLANCYTTSSTTGLTRWCPFLLFIQSLDLISYGITPGDGIKGYLDTDIIRACFSTYGQLYNDGQFIGMEDNFIVKWDSESTDTI